MKKKDVRFTIKNVDYVIRNVPYEEYDCDEALIDLNVAIKVTALRDLMYGNEIPKDVDFDTFSNIEF